MIGQLDNMKILGSPFFSLIFTIGFIVFLIRYWELLKNPIRLRLTNPSNSSESEMSKLEFITYNELKITPIDESGPSDDIIFHRVKKSRKNKTSMPSERVNFSDAKIALTQDLDK